jgi:hypothetical protein
MPALEAQQSNLWAKSIAKGTKESIANDRHKRKRHYAPYRATTKSLLLEEEHYHR